MSRPASVRHARGIPALNIRQHGNPVPSSIQEEITYINTKLFEYQNELYKFFNNELPKYNEHKEQYNDYIYTIYIIAYTLSQYEMVKQIYTTMKGPKLPSLAELKINVTIPVEIQQYITYYTNYTKTLNEKNEPNKQPHHTPKPRDVEQIEGGGFIGDPSGDLFVAVHNTIGKIQSIITKIEKLVKSNQVVPVVEADIFYDGEGNFYLRSHPGTKTDTETGILIKDFKYKFIPTTFAGATFNGFIDRMYADGFNAIDILKSSDTPGGQTALVWFKSLMPNIGDKMYVQIEDNTIYEIKCCINTEGEAITNRNVEETNFPELQGEQHDIGQTHNKEKEFYDSAKEQYKDTLVSIFNHYVTRFDDEICVTNLEYGYRYSPILFYITTDEAGIKFLKKPENDLLTRLNRNFFIFYHHNYLPKTDKEKFKDKPLRYPYTKHIMQGETWLCWCCSIMNKILLYKRLKKMYREPDSEEEIDPLDTLFSDENITPLLTRLSEKPEVKTNRQALKELKQALIKELKQALINFNPRDFYKAVFDVYDVDYQNFGFFAGTFEGMIFSGVGIGKLNNPITNFNGITITQKNGNIGIHYIVEVTKEFATPKYKIDYIIDSKQHLPSINDKQDSDRMNLQTGGRKRVTKTIIRKEKIGKSMRNIYKLEGYKKYYVKVNNEFVLYKEFCKQHNTNKMPLEKSASKKGSITNTNTKTKTKTNTDIKTYLPDKRKFSDGRERRVFRIKGKGNTLYVKYKGIDTEVNNIK